MPLSLAWEVVTETEPEWDDRERAKLLALATYEAGLCECGWHKDLTDDRSNHFTFDDRTCPVCKGTARWSRMQQAADEQAEKSMGENAPPGAARPSDGRHTSVRLMAPAEVEQRRQRR